MIGFLHTAAAHVATFDALLAEVDPSRASRAVVDPELLADARRNGPDSVRGAIAARLGELADADTIVCTCSTIGAVAEAVGHELGLRVVRVDRPMAEHAVAVGDRIAVVAAVANTLEPTRELLASVAARRGVTVTIGLHLVEGAWERFEAGDERGYVERIATALPAFARDADVVVLAQASMAAAAELTDLAVPVLSSPRVAIESIMT